ncbi:hypothetical protein B0H12DRAFT_1156155 [Mycena haematopus]|nr:hypothetical protein B0H12DRAFT_1156155 [Mycena haematopus]
MNTIPPDHFLALSRLDGLLGESAYDTTTLAAHDLILGGWELVLDGAIAERLQLGDKPGLTDTEKSRSESWRQRVRQVGAITFL